MTTMTMTMTMTMMLLMLLQMKTTQTLFFILCIVKQKQSFQSLQFKNIIHTYYMFGLTNTTLCLLLTMKMMTMTTNGMKFFPTKQTKMEIKQQFKGFIGENNGDDEHVENENIDPNVFKRMYLFNLLKVLKNGTEQDGGGGDSDGDGSAFFHKEFTKKQLVDHYNENNLDANTYKSSYDSVAILFADW